MEGNTGEEGPLILVNRGPAGPSQAVNLPLMQDRPAQRRQLYFIGVATALALALLGGFPLGILAALGGARDIGLGARWTPLVQAHGHLQLVGFAGLFIVGVAYQVLPRFKQTPLASYRLGLASIILLATGAALRAASQPWADSPPLQLLLVASACLELAGAAAFAYVAGRTVLAGQRMVFDYYFLTAAAWFVAASAANLVIAVELARDDASVVATARNVPLLEMYLLGFITTFVLGVSVRVLPHFLSLHPTRAQLLLPSLVTFTTGLAVRTAAGWADAYTDWSRPDWLNAAGVYAMAAAVVLFVFALNVFRPSARHPDDIPGPHEKLIRTAYVWLLVAFAIEAWYATKIIASDLRPDFLENGAARHALALGFITQMIMGVGSRALPTFAGKRLYSARLATIGWLLINFAALMRVGHAAVPWGSVAFRFDHIAAAGVLGLLAVMVFGFNTWRSINPPRRHHTSAPSPNAVKGVRPPEEPFRLTPASIVADILANVPGSLELLVTYGFGPLADPEMRARVAPHVTLAAAAGMQGVNVDKLINDLAALQARHAPEALRLR
jgi:hypothetical protein